LLKRNVELDWYNTTHHSKNLIEENENSVVIGYMINTIEPFSITAPHRLFFESRHWYAITRLHRVTEENYASVDNTDNDDNFKKSNIYVDETTGHEFYYNKERWYIIDSKNLTIVNLNSNNDLQLYLARIASDGGSILQATLKQSERRL
jgi:hypothetical protein